MARANHKLNRIYPVINFIALAAVIFLLIEYFRHSQKIVYVDSGKLLTDYKGAERAKKEFDTKAKSWQQNIDTLTQAVRQSITDYEKKASRMSRQESGMAKQLINVKRRDLSNYQKAVQENAANENTKLMSPVISRVNKFLLDYGKSHDYNIILIANQSGTIAYAKEGLDITDQVVKALNREYPEQSK